MNVQGFLTFFQVLDFSFTLSSVLKRRKEYYELEFGCKVWCLKYKWKSFISNNLVNIFLCRGSL